VGGESPYPSTGQGPLKRKRCLGKEARTQDPNTGRKVEVLKRERVRFLLERDQPKRREKRVIIVKGERGGQKTSPPRGSKDRSRFKKKGGKRITWKTAQRKGLEGPKRKTTEGRGATKKKKRGVG